MIKFHRLLLFLLVCSFCVGAVFATCSGHQGKSKRIIRTPKSTSEDAGIESATETLQDVGDDEEEDEIKEERNRKVKNGELYIPDDYNKFELPRLQEDLGLESDSVPVTVFFNIRSIREFDEFKEEIVLDVDLLVQWVDWTLFKAARTQYIEKILSPVFLKKIWKPDIYMDDLKSVAQPVLMGLPVTLKFRPGLGLFSYTSRVTINLDCQMNFQYYPADIQKCDFVLRSYAYYSTDLQLQWVDQGAFLQNSYNPNYYLQVGNVFTVKASDPLSSLQTFFGEPNATIDELHFSIFARRKLSYHLVQTYLFSFFFIVTAWLCFLVPKQMVETRIGILMTNLLTLTALFASVRSSTPVVSYVKAIDIWMVCCILSVFIILLYFSIFLWIRKYIKNHNHVEDDYKLDDQVRRPSMFSSSRNPAMTLKIADAIYNFVDKYDFLIFTILFLILGFWYWTWLFVTSKYFDWVIDPTHNVIDNGVNENVLAESR